MLHFYILLFLFFVVLDVKTHINDPKPHTRILNENAEYYNERK